jgi:uncharacterized membrane protein
VRAPVWITIDGEERLSGISQRRHMLDRLLVGAVGATTDALRQHWLLLINLALTLVVGGALAIPVLFALGRSQLASGLFAAYHLVCSQIPSHSYFILGHQLGLCARNLAIYGSLLAGSILFRFVRAWLPTLRGPLWLLTLAPMALDGGTQLLGWRESTWGLRTLTGALFGLGVCWFVLPQIERAAAAAAALRAPAVSASPQGALRFASGGPATMRVSADGGRDTLAPQQHAQGSE